MNIDRFKEAHIQILDSIAALRSHAHAGIAENAELIVSISRLVPRKGFDTAIRAAALLRSSRPNLVLAVAARSLGGVRARQMPLLAAIGLGDLTIRVPADVRVQVRHDLGLGEVRVRDLDGTETVHDGAGRRGTDTLGTGPTLTLDVEVGLGEARVERIQR